MSRQGSRSSSRTPKPSEQALAHQRQEEERIARREARKKDEKEAAERKLEKEKLAQTEIKDSHTTRTTSKSKDISNSRSNSSDSGVASGSRARRAKPSTSSHSQKRSNAGELSSDTESPPTKKIRKKPPRSPEKSTTSDSEDDENEPKQRKKSTGKKQKKVFTIEEAAAANPKIKLVLFLHQGVKATICFRSTNIILTDVEKAQNNIEKPKSHDLGIHFNDGDFNQRILPAIAACIQTNLPDQELYDHGNGHSIYHRGYGIGINYTNQFDEDMFERDIIPISTGEDWQVAIRRSVGVETNGDGSLGCLWLHLLCHTRKKPKPKTKRSSQSESQSSSQLQLAQDSQQDEDDTEEDWTKALPFGWDKTLKLCIQGPTYERQEGNDRFILRYKKVQFLDEEIYMLPPPYTREFLEDDDNPKDLPDLRHRYKAIESLLKATAYSLTSYKNHEGRTLLGEESYFFVQPNFGTADMHPITRSDHFWEHVQKRFNGMNASARTSNDPVEVRISFGAKAADDVAYSIPDYYYGEDDIGPVLETTQIPAEAMFSQGSTASPRKTRPPVIPTKKSAGQQRAAQNLSSDDVSAYIWKVHTHDESHLKNAFTDEHAKSLKGYFMKYQKDGRAIHEIYPCNEGDPDSWLPLSAIPEHIRSNPEKFCGQVIEPGKHLPIDPDTYGSYRPYKKSPEQRAKELEDKRRQSFVELVQAFGGGGSGRGTTYFSIRIELDPVESMCLDTVFYDQTKPSNSTETLEELYNAQGVRVTVRSQFRYSVRTAVRNGTRELVLEYKNHKNGAVYCVFPVRDLATVKVSDLIGSIPHNNTGPIDGAAFPIVLSLKVQSVVSLTGLDIL